jgi:hypothetical protein
MNIRAYIWHMNNAQNTQDMITNNNLVSFSSYAATAKEALQMMGMEVNNAHVTYFVDTVRFHNLPLDNCHILNGTFVKSTAYWCDVTKSFLIRTKSEKA